MSMIGNVKSVDGSIIDGLLANPESVHDIVHPEDETEDQSILDLDKSWHAIHYVLTGEAWAGEFPNGFLVSCGQQIGDEDVGYGPARAFRPDEVKRISEYLIDIDDGLFLERFSIEKLKNADIYPSFGDQTKEEEVPYFLQYFQELKQFIQKCSEANKGILVFID